MSIRSPLLLKAINLLKTMNEVPIELLVTEKRSIGQITYELRRYGYAVESIKHGRNITHIKLIAEYASNASNIKTIKNADIIKQIQHLSTLLTFTLDETQNNAINRFISSVNELTNELNKQ